MIIGISYYQYFCYQYYIFLGSRVYLTRDGEAEVGREGGQGRDSQEHIEDEHLQVITVNNNA